MEDTTSLIPFLFNPLPSSEGRLWQVLYLLWQLHLQSTSLIRGKTTRTVRVFSRQTFFNPLPSSEGRHSDFCRRLLAQCIFNPLPSSEGRQSVFSVWFNFRVLQSTSLIRGKTIRQPLAFSQPGALQSTSLIRGKTAKLPDSFLKSKYIFSTFIQFHLLSL